MTSMYYRMQADSDFPVRWFPGEPLDRFGREIDARDFTNGVPYIGAEPRHIPLDVSGPAPKFTLAAFDMPVVACELAQAMEKLAPAAIERFPVTIGDGIDGFEVINVVGIVDCVDESRTEVMKWTDRDGRPDKVGKYRMLTNLSIDPTRARDKHIFRIDDWEIALIVSEEMKSVMQQFEQLGIVFSSVTDDD